MLPSFQWPSPTLLSVGPVAVVVADNVAGMVIVDVVDTVVAEVGSDTVLDPVFEHSLTGLSRRNLDDFSNPDYKY